MQNKANFDDFNIDEVEAKKFIRLGIKGELAFEVMSRQTSRYQLLSETHLHEIYKHHPKEASVCLTSGYYNPTSRTQPLPLPQRINYRDLWFDEFKFKAILEKDSDFSTKDSSPKKPTPDDLLLKSPYFKQIIKLSHLAIEQFPQWRKTQKKIQKTGNLITWLKETIAVKNIRDVDFIIKILSDIYNLPS